MTTRSIWLCIATLSAGVHLAGSAQARPYAAIERIAGATPVTVRVSDKPRVYFRVTPGAPLTVPIEGPVRVRLVSRAECAREGVVTYRLTVTERGKPLDQLDTESSASTEARLEKGGPALAKSRRLGFDLPDGRHEITIGLSGAAAALVRLQTASVRGSEAMVSLTPISAARSVNVAEGEKLIPYFSVTSGTPVRLRVIGPTTLELSSRLDFDATMRGVQGYRLRLSEGARTLRELDIKTTKAVAASYENVRDRVPSKLDVTRIPIPEGTHEILVALLLPARGTAQVHARIPEPSVGNEE